MSIWRRIFNTTSDQLYMPEWNVPKPTHLWMANHPTEPEKLMPLRKIEKLLRFKWTEIILTDYSISDEIIELLAEERNDLTKISLKEHEARLQEIFENCAIRWIDDEIGWSLTLRRGKSLSKGFLTCYAGLLGAKTLGKKSSYSAREYFFSLFKTKNKDVGVDAKHYGNLSRVLPFLLEKEQLEYFHIDPSVKDQIAIANCKFQIALVNGVQTPCAFLLEDLCAPPDREILLGVNYSSIYLLKMQQKNKTFKLLDKDTLTQLDPQLYSKKLLRVSLEGLKYEFNISRLRVMIGRNFPNLSLTTKAYDERRKKYYKITLSNQAIYQAMMETENQDSITVKPLMVHLD